MCPQTSTPFAFMNDLERPAWKTRRPKRSPQFSKKPEDQLATKVDLERMKMELESSIAQSKAETVKWVAGMLVAQAAIIAGTVKLL